MWLLGDGVLELSLGSKSLNVDSEVLESGEAHSSWATKGEEVLEVSHGLVTLGTILNTVNAHGHGWHVLEFHLDSSWCSKTELVLEVSHGLVALSTILNSVDAHGHGWHVLESGEAHSSWTAKGEEVLEVDEAVT